MNHSTILKTVALGMLVAAVGGTVPPAGAQNEIPYTDNFFLDSCRLSSNGVNDYFIPLRPGAYRLYKGEDDGASQTLLISVLARTKKVAGVECAVVQEMEWEDDEIVEISWNYFAICRKCGDVFYFGEDVDIYEDGEVVSHDGAWLAGKRGAKPGLLMPGRPLNGARYYQEIAPNVALDRAEHLSDSVTVETPAGRFVNCLFVAETTPLEPGHVSFKHYARGIGMIQDGVLALVEYGSNRNYAFQEHEDDSGDD